MSKETLCALSGSDMRTAIAATPRLKSFSAAALPRHGHCSTMESGCGASRRRYHLRVLGEARKSAEVIGPADSVDKQVPSIIA